MASTASPQPPDGFDVDAVEAWLADEAPFLRHPLRWTPLDGGHSNLTCRIEATDGHTVVIRRPPQGELQPKAHDMVREWTIISALGPTAVPVPTARAFCEDVSVTGAPFYVMGFVAGEPLRMIDDTERLVPISERPGLAFDYIDRLAALHRLDPAEVGLGTLGRPDGYVLRQLTAWYRSWTRSIETADLDDPRAHDLHNELAATVPEQGSARVVHGDYGLHNVLVGVDHRVAAVVDWEVCTLGDPLADLSYGLIGWPDEPDDQSVSVDAATRATGFPTRSDLAARYAEQTGANLASLGYYHAFNYWKRAAIGQGVLGRYRAGNKSADGQDLDERVAKIYQHLDLAESALRSSREGEQR